MGLPKQYFSVPKYKLGTCQIQLDNLKSIGIKKYGLKYCKYLVYY